MKEKNKELVGILGQYISGCLLLLGIITEAWFHAQIWLIIITTGSLLWGVSTKLRGK